MLRDARGDEIISIYLKTFLRARLVDCVRSSVGQLVTFPWRPQSARRRPTKPRFHRHLCSWRPARQSPMLPPSCHGDDCLCRRLRHPRRRRRCDCRLRLRHHCHRRRRRRLRRLRRHRSAAILDRRAAPACLGSAWVPGPPSGSGVRVGGSRSGAGAGSGLGLRLLVDGRLHRARAEDDAATARLQAVLEGHLHEGLPADVVGRLAERVVPLEREEVELALGFVRDDDLRLLGLGRPTVPAAQQCFAKLSQGE